MNEKNNPSHHVSPAFNEPHSLAIRIWHWSFFAVLSASLITVLLASTIFRTRNNIDMVTRQLRQQEVTVNPQQARNVAHAFNDLLWTCHTYAGYILCGFLLARILIEIMLSKEEKISSRIRQAFYMNRIALTDSAEWRHYLRVKWSYLIFYCLILIMALTGLGLAFEDIPFLKTIHSAIQQIHSFVQYLIYTFIILHLFGVIVADAGKYPGIVSGMIHGKKRSS